MQYTTVKPLGDRVLVKIKSSEDKTSGGILLPTTAQSKPQGGEVVAIGEGRTIGKNKIEITVKVLFGNSNLLMIAVCCYQRTIFILVKCASIFNMNCLKMTSLLGIRPAVSCVRFFLAAGVGFMFLMISFRCFVGFSNLPLFYFILECRLVARLCTQNMLEQNSSSMKLTICF